MRKAAIWIVLWWGLIVLGPTAFDTTTPRSGDSALTNPVYNGGTDHDRRTP